MKSLLIVPSILIVAILILLYTSIESPFQYQTFEGHIIEEFSGVKRFYIQENEGGDVVELKFIHEESELLSFEDFGYVIIDGHYNPEYNYIIVDEIQSVNDKSAVSEEMALNE